MATAPALNPSPQGRAATAAVVDRVRAITAESLPDPIRAVARQCILDWFAVTLAGAEEPLSTMLLDQALEDGGNPIASLVGHARKVSTRQAALINGAMSHALDYDDVNFSMGGHPTVAALPGMLALAEQRKASGKDVLTAFVAGYEALGMVGLLVAPGHYARGFHATATVGSFGSAAACAHLLGFDADTTARALGIAGTQAAGLKSQFGTMCKPLHAGKAAENGLIGAQLAARGYTSRTDILECVQGFAATQSPDFNMERALSTPEGGFHVRNNLFKYNAACYGTHGAIEGLRTLVREQGLKPEDIASIRLKVEPGADKMCNIREPKTGLEAKFSLRFNAALSVLGGDTAAPETYSEATAADPKIVQLRDRVSVEPQGADWGHSVTESIVDLKTGRQLQVRHDTGIPAADIARQGERVTAKFMSLVVPVLGENRAKALAAAVDGLEGLKDVGALMELARA